MFTPILDNLASIIATQFTKGGGYDPFSQAMWDWGNRLNPVTGLEQWHNGIDLPAPGGTPIYSPIDGELTVKHNWTGDKDDDPSGNYIIIRVKDKEYPDLYEVAFCHLSKFGDNMAVGVDVLRGQIIGYVGSTGRSTGNHLHFIVRRGTSNSDKQDVNPLDYFQKKTLTAQGMGILAGLAVAGGLLYWYFAKTR